MIHKKPNIKQVAYAAGVSTQTVSRVINDHPAVARETRNRVLQIINELDYRPSILARSMNSQRTSSIGFITAGLYLSTHLYTFDAITAEADRLGYSLLLKTLPVFEPGLADDVLRSLMDRQVDGMIWAVPEIDDYLQWLANINPAVPTVVLNTDKLLGHAVISLDNYNGAYEATKHLIQQGYQAIGHITGPLTGWEARERKRGWQDALRDANRFIPEKAVAEGDWSMAGGYKAITQLFAQYPEMDAFFACNDRVALSGLLYASRIGKKVPAELGIVGFDDIAESAYFSPPLTTITQDYQALGQITVQKLVGLIESHGKTDISHSERVVIQPRLVVRESTSSRSG
jgi:LacI family transcriptional regulator